MTTGKKCLREELMQNVEAIDSNNNMDPTLLQIYKKKYKMFKRKRRHMT